MNILAFDLATFSGWAQGRLGDPIPAFGTTRFGSTGCSSEARFGNALEWFSEFIKRQKPDLIAFEAPLHFGLRRGNSQAGNDEVSFGLAAILQAVAHLRGCYRVEAYRTIDVRRFFLGDNPKRKVAKRETINGCRALGIDVQNDDEADAVALWLYACAQIRPQLGLRSSPLFRGVHASSLPGGCANDPASD